jgi:hypothetical protein
MGYMQLAEYSHSSSYNFTVNITIPVKRRKEELQEKTINNPWHDQYFVGGICG